MRAFGLILGLSAVRNGRKNHPICPSCPMQVSEGHEQINYYYRPLLNLGAPQWELPWNRCRIS